MGAVLHTLNIRLTTEQIRFIGNHAEDRTCRSRRWPGGCHRRGGGGPFCLAVHQGFGHWCAPVQTDLGGCGCDRPCRSTVGRGGAGVLLCYSARAELIPKRQPVLKLYERRVT